MNYQLTAASAPALIDDSHCRRCSKPTIGPGSLCLACAYEIKDDTLPLKGPKKTRLINRAAVRELALELAKKRAHKFSRVSEETLIGANEAVRRYLAEHVSRVPSKGKTL
jgi:hypothetical protein